MTITDLQRRGSLLYTGYAWTTFVTFLTGAFACAALLPGLERRRRWVSRFARGFFHAAGIPVTVRGHEHLPEGHVVVVANHASYLDGVILQAFLPPRFSYVIKSEMSKVPVGGFFLRRIGSRFVERFVASAGARDARTLMRAASDGEALAFFPEGTFTLEPGVGRFRPGAFVTAIKASVPLVPVAIHGSRSVLPAGTMRVRRDSLIIDIQPHIHPEHDSFDDHRDLAAEARRRILAVLDEPDLLSGV